jgi:hypothetical protein
MPNKSERKGPLRDAERPEREPDNADGKREE